MRRLSSWHHGAILVLLLGCGGDDDGTAADASSSDDAGGSDASSGPGPGTAVMVPLVVGDERPIGVFTVHGDGSLDDPDILLDAPAIARAITFTPDGRDALAIYGIGPASAKGALAILLEPDGSAAEVVQDLVIEAQNSPNSVILDGANQAVVAMRGPDPDYLLSLTLSDDWALGPEVVTSEGPSLLYDIGEPGHALLLQADLFTEDGFHAYPIGRREDGGWEIEAAGVDFGDEFVIDLAVAPSGDAAYVSIDNPDDEDVINPSGLVMMLGADERTRAWSPRGEPTPLEDAGSQIAISREGRVAVVADPVAAIDPDTGQPVLSHYELETIAIAEDGTPSQIAGSRTMMAADIVDDFAFAPNETLLVVLSSSDGNFLIAFQRDDPGASDWRLTDMIELPGSPSAVFISPAPS
jgi:hypothetical protein